MMSISTADVKGPSLEMPSPATDTPALEAGMVNEKESSPNVVNWDGDNDQLNPQNWKDSKKWLNVLVIALMTISTPLASTMFAPGVPQVMSEFHSKSTILSTIVISIFVLGFALGPLIIAPLSEIYGRRPTYILSNLFFIIFTIACAVSSNLGMLIAFRFLAGCAGSTPVTIGGASIGDMFSVQKRGSAMAVWGMGPVLGPVLGPVIGGFLAQAKGWRWAFWLQSIIAGASLILGILYLKETYAPVILEQKTKRLVKETGNQELKSTLHDGLTFGKRIRIGLIRPLQLLFTSPIVMVLAIYIAFLFGYLYLFVTTFPLVFAETYHFSTGATGLTYLGMGVGMFFGLIIAGRTSDVVFRKLTARNHGVAEPEFRLPLLAVSCPLIVVGFFWYGWSVEAKSHWIVPILGTSLFGLGLMPGVLSINMYLVQTYGRYAASAVAATRVLQSVGGAFLPLVGKPLYQRLGLGWGNSVLAFIAMLFVPIPWLFFKYGNVLRRWSGV